LIVGIAGEEIGLFRTSQLSGELIASLEEQSNRAFERAVTILTLMMISKALGITVAELQRGLKRRVEEGGGGRRGDVFEEIRFTAGNIMSPMKQIATTIISVSCLLGLLFIAPSALAKKAKPKSRTSQTPLAKTDATFQNDTRAALRDITTELKTKVTQDELKAIGDDLKKVEQKADETAVEVRIGMLVGAAIAVVLGVLIYRLFSRIVPDSGKLSIT
jgi:tetrahydromethanopterin S-methyltransferase subunit G